MADSGTAGLRTDGDVGRHPKEVGKTGGNCSSSVTVRWYTGARLPVSCEGLSSTTPTHAVAKHESYRPQTGVSRIDTSALRSPQLLLINLVEDGEEALAVHTGLQAALGTIG